MKEPDIKKKFDVAAEAFAKRLEDSYATTYLTALRDAVQELQESGVNISLDVRLHKNGSSVTRPESSLANAITVADGQPLEWFISATYRKATLAAYDASGLIANFESERESWTKPWPAPPTLNAVSLKDAIMNVVIDNIAQAKMVAAYSVPATGVTGMLDKKALAPPLLKAPVQ